MLQVIQNNPFRILGIGSNASPQEIGKRYNQLRMAETDNAIDLSGFLGKVNRTDESMLEAFKLLQDSNIRISYAQFWFMRQNAADDLAFNNVNANNIGLALSVWSKQKSVIALQNSLMCYLLRNQKVIAVLNCAASLYSDQYREDFLRTLGGGELMRLTESDLIRSLLNVFLDEEPFIIKAIRKETKNPLWQKIIDEEFTIAPEEDRSYQILIQPGKDAVVKSTSKFVTDSQSCSKMVIKASEEWQEDVILPDFSVATLSQMPSGDLVFPQGIISLDAANRKVIIRINGFNDKVFACRLAINGNVSFALKKIRLESEKGDSVPVDEQGNFTIKGRGVSLPWKAVNYGADGSVLFQTSCQLLTEQSDGTYLLQVEVVKDGAPQKDRPSSGGKIRINRDFVLGLIFGLVLGIGVYLVFDLIHSKSQSQCEPEGKTESSSDNNANTPSATTDRPEDTDNPDADILQLGLEEQRRLEENVEKNFNALYARMQSLDFNFADLETYQKWFTHTKLKQEQNRKFSYTLHALKDIRAVLSNRTSTISDTQRYSYCLEESKSPFTDSEVRMAIYNTFGQEAQPLVDKNTFGQEAQPLVDKPEKNIPRSDRYSHKFDNSYSEKQKAAFNAAKTLFIENNGSVTFYDLLHLEY